MANPATPKTKVWNIFIADSFKISLYVRIIEKESAEKEKKMGSANFEELKLHTLVASQRLTL
ncbi:hypothetical protein EJB05_00409, partial [Eragrostis curvula]